MNLMIFPRMLSSHGAGWDWLKRLHPSAAKMYLFYVLPLCLVPPAMLYYALDRYQGVPLPHVEPVRALVIVGLFLAVELAAVPVMATVIQRIGAVAEATTTYQDAFTLAAVVPTPLWLAPLALFVPSLLFNVGIMILAWFGAGLLIYQGVARTFDTDDEGKSRLLAAAVLAAGLVAWAILMVLTLVSWGWAIQ